MRVSEIRVKQIRVNQGLGVHKYQVMQLVQFGTFAQIHVPTYEQRKKNRKETCFQKGALFRATYNFFTGHLRNNKVSQIQNEFMRSSFFSKCKQKIKRISTLGTIQVLMILTFFDPPTLSSDVIISYTHLNVTSSFPHTHPPSKIRQGLFLLKKSDILERINRFQVSFATDDGHPPCHQTSSFGHPTHPPL